jgi:hypothetical protein
MFQEIVNTKLSEKGFQKRKRKYVYPIDSNFTYVIDIEFVRSISTDKIKCYSIVGGVYSDVYFDILESKKNARANYSSKNLILTSVFRNEHHLDFIEISEDSDLISLTESINNSIEYHISIIKDYIEIGVVRKLIEHGGLLESILSSVYTTKAKDVELIKQRLSYLNPFWKEKLRSVIGYFPDYVIKEINK